MVTTKILRRSLKMIDLSSGADAISISGLLLKESRLLNPKKLIILKIECYKKFSSPIS